MAARSAALLALRRVLAQERNKCGGGVLLRLQPECGAASPFAAITRGIEPWPRISPDHGKPAIILEHMLS